MTSARRPVVEPRVDKVAEADEDDLRLTGVDRILPTLQAHLKADEWRRAAHIFSRGGRFGEAPAKDAGPVKHWQRPATIWNETVGSNRHSLTGDLFTGCPTWHPPRFTDGSRVEAHYNPVDAAQAGISTGDRVRVSTPGGAVDGVAMLRDGVTRGAVAVEHGYGHRELGARTHYVDGKALPGDEAIGAGVNLNDLGLVDPTHGSGNAWLDWVTGASVRQALPARIEKVS